MKKVLSKIFEIFLWIVAVPFAIIAGIALLLYTPIAIFKYRRSAFYRDTHHKYEMFIRNAMWFQLYEIMRKDNLPLSFHLHSTDEDTRGYFYYRDTLLAMDWPMEYAPNQQEWFVLYDNEDHEPCTPMSEALELELNAFHKNTGSAECHRAVVLADMEYIADEDRPHLAECPDILPYQGKKDLSRALKAWIETMN